ncbi:MAG TPA: RNA 2'-phosphotransferase [Candidatus Acidoferrales bacterium]|nr:RNA 2'-phosphotransferase [Candidatus Acidoferrales bacterium]
MARSYENLSRALSHALRHEPWLYELELDEEGWADVGATLAALRRESAAWSNLTEFDLAEMIHTSSKQRHELVNGRVRARYGHSLPGKLRRTPALPPPRLFHGTSPAAILKIREGGLLPMGRQYVHLSLDLETAVAVGRRKSNDPIIITVRAEDAWNAGVVFYEGNEKVWLADLVPPEFLDLIEHER